MNQPTENPQKSLNVSKNVAKTQQNPQKPNETFKRTGLGF